MIATCPACGKRYRLADDAVPPGGRNVRCAACGHGWSVVPGGDAVADAPLADWNAPPAGMSSARAEAAAVVNAPGVATPVSPAAAASGPREAPVAAKIAAAVPPEHDDTPLVRRPHVRIGWLAAVVALLAVAALAVVEFAPETTFDPPRLGLPAAHLPLADLGSLRLPALPEIPPFDPARVPLVGDALDRLIHPPASPLRIAVRGERHRLATGGWLLTASGTVANPTAAPVPLAGIDAALADPAGRVALRWRIAAPASVIGAHGSAAFETTAANFPAEATVLRLRPR